LNEKEHGRLQPKTKSISSSKLHTPAFAQFFNRFGPEQNRM
jgi:hypothetical protein